MLQPYVSSAHLAHIHLVVRTTAKNLEVFIGAIRVAPDLLL
jgi:hypothetical protein